MHVVVVLRKTQEIIHDLVDKLWENFKGKYLDGLQTFLGTVQTGLRDRAAGMKQGILISILIKRNGMKDANRTGFIMNLETSNDDLQNRQKVSC